MRKLLSLLFILFALKAISQQPFNNEWIDYSKTYYKFKIGTSGLYRINLASLTNIGLQNTPVEQFQLWRNGKQVPLYTSIATGILGSSDYIEFWGKRNDGKPDKYLYKDTSYQLSDRVSLQTDTAAFFLTVNPTPSASNPNLRFQVAQNNIPATPPAPLPYFTYTQNFDFEQLINPGFAMDANPEYVYSSSYDIGEFWGSQQILPGAPISVPVNSLYAASAGSSATLQGAFVASVYGSRTVQVNFNNDNINGINGSLSGMTPSLFSATIPINTLTGNPTSLGMSIAIPTQTNPDYVVCNNLQLTYPRLFNFGGQTNFFFNLPASPQSNYLQITNFSSGSATPVLYDFTNKLYYQANTSVAGTLQFYLPPSSTATEYLLVSEDVSVNAITTVSSFQQRNFINYATQSNQGDYLIISNKLLGLTNGGAVDQYRAYRSNAFNAKVYDIDDLEDQFAFGIKKHPLSIKNFIRYASSVFSKVPSYVLFIGKGVTYDQYRNNQNSPYADRLNLVPTWGWPASDAMLVSPSVDPNPTIGFGRVSAVTQAEVNIYLSKVKEYEAQLNLPQTIEARGWMKNVIHVAGADDSGLFAYFDQAFGTYANIITGPFFGANAYYFSKTTTSQVSGGANALLTSLINNGASLLTYFGHGSSTVLDYAPLNDPTSFNNTGKYPLFLVNGCSVGNFFDFDTARMSALTSYSEKFLFAQELGSIGIVGNSHFGITTYLNDYTTGFYQSLASTGYNTGVATNMLAGIALLKSNGGGNFSQFYTRTHSEETVLEGDPAIKIYASAKPDYVVEPQNVVISPSILSVANTSFTIKTYLYNIGKYTIDSLNVTITRVYPNGTTAVLYNQKRSTFAYIDSVVLIVPIIGTRDKGTNQIIVSINSNKSLDEVTFNNNSSTVSFVIFDNGITPVYPYNYAIVNKQNIQLIASTANPLTPINNYVMELDTSALFKSPLITQKVSSIGGAISFPLTNFIFTDSTVYYWRVAQVPTSGAYIYNTSSFVYLKNASTGFNQSHLYQHLNSSMKRIYLDSSSRQWNFSPVSNSIDMRLAIFSAQNVEPADFATFINGTIIPYSACVGHSLIFNIYDPVKLVPLYNQAAPSIVATDSAGGFMGSALFCGMPGREWNFEFQMYDTSGIRPARDFVNWVTQNLPGYIVTARLNYDNPTPFADVWAADSVYYGANNTLYSALKGIGFSELDSFNRERTFGLIYKSNTPSFRPQWKFTNTIGDIFDLVVNVIGTDTLGFVTSPQFGPASKWNLLKWRGSSLQAKPTNSVTIYVLGIDTLGNQTLLQTFNNNLQDQDISSINAAQYPYIQLMMRNSDSINLTPYQLRYWRVLANLVPEGAMAPNIKYVFVDSASKIPNATDTFQAGELINEAIAFKNVSDTIFRDSITVQAQVLDNSNNVNILPVGKLKKIVPGDTAVVNFTINTANFVGNNTLYVNVNPNNSQPEQYHFNNFIYKSFYVKPDNTNPVLDVTFDGTHILSNDIVSSKPNIQVKLVENSKTLLLTDTSAISVQLKYPDGSTHKFSYSSDSLRFTPASPNASENAAISILTPTLTQDGTYELIVAGKNRAGLAAGSQQYTVQFQVINKAMISNVFNYPNPFTTSTQFIFTLTGSTVPQNIKIEIMTISGRIVKEITRDQLGPLHIGNNRTTYKWDGTDMFGAKLGNGVYLYRVVTRLNGNSIDKYGADSGGPNTDQYFKGGYGKMYLMR